MQVVEINPISIQKNGPFTVISGPCVIESETHTLKCVEHLLSLFDQRGIQFIFKASYDKANRSSIHSFRGIGIEKGLKLFEKIKKEFRVPVLTDVHTVEEVVQASSVCDVLQIPAFLCRQTDLVVEAGSSGVPINLKKGQFMSPWEMKQVIEKIHSTGNENILLTERGTCFGYNNLVSDMRSIPLMQQLGYPVFFDATHSVQLPGALGDRSGGERQFIPTLARAAIAAGCNGIYAESHPDPENAKSDASTVLSFQQLSHLLDEWEHLYNALHLSCSNPI